MPGTGAASTSTPQGQDSPRDAPSLSLPTAGGAIRGMGEKFSSNPVTGTASLSIPVPVSPARDGGAPQLTLAYDSGSGNGPFGLGWSLDTGSVTRRTDKGIPRYIDDGPDADVFQLSSAEDLVPVSDTAGVVGYRPRTEGLFSRIERLRDPATGALWWRVTSKDNVTAVFGRTAAARVSDPADPTKVYRWLLEQSTDERGNVSRYEYKSDGANRYLKRVRYGNRTADGDFCFEVVLDYGEHDADLPDETAAWADRLDPFSVRRPGFEVRTERLCQRILMFHHIPELSADPVLVASTDLTYAPDPASTKLVSARHSGYIAEGNGYKRKRQPPVTLTYAPRVVAPVEGVVTAASADAPPRADGGYQWTDLDGDGIAGVLTEQAGAWHYRHNLGGGTLAPPEVVDPLPTGAGFARGSRLMDLAGDGRQVLTRLDGSAPGYHRRTDDRSWSDLRPFAELPVLDWGDPNLRFVDLTGDGLADILRTSSDGFTWHPSAGLDGFTESAWTAAAATEERGPRLVFADPGQSIYLADLTGDGLTDLVRIRNGEVCYWPNLGYGRFGAKITMAGAPVFDHPDRFDQRRVHLSDVDGSSPADLLYIGPDSVRVWFNQAGNSWSAAETLTLAGLTDPGAVQVTDLLGTGTACLVQADRRPDGEPQLRYLDLMAAGKPHLLTTISNGMGLTTMIGYRSSTTFSLADRAAGEPWLTRLPFPVHVVADITVDDSVASTTAVTTFRYRHGFYDSVEREFRGFAYVEQRDALSFVGPDDRLRQPPAVMKRWQHTGWYPGVDRISHQYTDEYWGSGPLLDDTVIPGGLSTEEEREVFRALRGRVLREEVYTEDADGQIGNPYTVTETNYGTRVLQRRGDALSCVVLVEPGETVTVHTERKPEDPRIGHVVTLEVDDWGNVLRAVNIAYPRRSAVEPGQERQFLTVSERDVVNDVESGRQWRVGITVEQREYEAGGLRRASGLFTAKELRDSLASAAEIPFQDKLSGDAPQRRLISRTRQTYYSADQATELAAGKAATPLLPYRTYRQAFGTGQVPDLYGGRVTDDMLAGAGYVQADGVWWVPSWRQVFDPAQFFLPVTWIDPFGSQWQVGYDRHMLRNVRIEDPLGNVSQAVLNYRVLRPWLLTDPNLNRTGIRFDALGMVVATAVMGKGEGDTLDLSTVEYSAADRPTSWLAYDLDVLPVRFATFTREKHGVASPVRETHTYGDGTGRTILTKVQAEPEPGQTAPRWAGTGRTIFDNKARPIKKYEPYFAADSGFDTEPELVQRGVTAVLRYDPLGRLIATDFPDGTRARIEFDAWDQEDWDRNDTVLESPWYATRSTLPPSDPRRQVADATAMHARTPTRTFFDALGRPCVITADNRTEHLKTIVDRDVQGNESTRTDPRGIEVLAQEFDMLKRAAHVVSPDSGERWSLADVTGKPMYSWDSRGTTTRVRYDVLRRPTHSYSTAAGATERLRLRTFYGERVESAAAHNLRTRPYAVFDGAGVQLMVDVDFKGNVLTMQRRLAANPRTEPDWAVLAEVDDPNAALDAARFLVETDLHTTSTVFDALNRPTLVTSPDGSRTRHTYNVAGLLESVDAHLRGTDDWTPFVTDIDYDVRGQRTRIARGCGTHTVYQYEPDTFRLSSVDSKDPAGKTLQSLRYTYDPVGNIIVVADPSQETVFYANNAVGSTRIYSYEPIYRLSTANGREHIGQTSQPAAGDLPHGPLPHANDSTALRAYVETYSYDKSGNLTELAHSAPGGSWTRRHSIAADSNRLLANSIPGDAPGDFSARYTYDAAGNTISMPHLATMDWDADNRLVHTGLGGGGDAYYQYDASGTRVRATTVNGGTTETRIYLGLSELYLKIVAGTTRTRRETLHIGDGGRRVAIVETTTVDNARPVIAPVPVQRYQLDDHLGSATIELDDTSAVLTYEEYHPFGTTSFHCAPRNGIARKRYRFTGKERDDETGFTYHGARYYIPWLARWASPDPAGLVDGPARYSYVRNNPIILHDPSGTEGEKDKPEIAGNNLPSLNSAQWKAGVQQAVEADPFRGGGKANREASMRDDLTTITNAIDSGAVAADVGIRNQLYQLRQHPSELTRKGQTTQVGEAPIIHVLAVLAAKAQERFNAGDHRKPDMSIVNIFFRGLHAKGQAVDIGRYAGQDMKAENKNYLTGLKQLVSDLPDGYYGVGLPRLPLKGHLDSEQAHKDEGYSIEKKRGYFEKPPDDRSDREVVPTPKLMETEDEVSVPKYDQKWSGRGLENFKPAVRPEMTKFTGKMENLLTKVLHWFVDGFDHAHISVVGPKATHF
jgi:RHS repeat-associated protein